MVKKTKHKTKQQKTKPNRQTKNQKPFCLKLFLCNSRQKQWSHSSTLITNREPYLQWKNLIKKSGNRTLLVTLADKAVPFAENGSLGDATFSQRNPAFIRKMIKPQAAALGGKQRQAPSRTPGEGKVYFLQHSGTNTSAPRPHSS